MTFFGVLQVHAEEIQNNDENIGGAEELLTIEAPIVENTEETAQNEEILVLSQMELDANYIKSSIFHLLVQRRLSMLNPHINRIIVEKR